MNPMKTLFTLFTFGILFTGCEKKDHKCVCKITSHAFMGAPESTSEETYIIHNTKRKARKECDSHEPKGFVILTTTSCEIS